MPGIPAEEPSVPAGLGSSGAAVPWSGFPGSAEPAPFPEASSVEPLAPLGDVQVEEVGGGRRNPALMWVVIAALLLGILVTFLLVHRPGKAAPAGPPAGPDTATRSGAVSAPVVPVSAAPAPAVTPAVTSAAPKVDVEALVKQEMARKEAEMRRKLDAQESQLRKEIAKAQAAAKKKAAQANEGAGTPPPQP
jgi:hypothetical protein